MEILLIGLPIAALVGWLIGKPKGLADEGALLGALLGPLGWLIVAGLKSKGMRKCRFCAEEIRKEATVCRYCGRDAPEEVRPPTRTPSGWRTHHTVIMIVLVATVVLLVLIGHLQS